MFVLACKIFDSVDFLSFPALCYMATLTHLSTLSNYYCILKSLQMLVLLLRSNFNKAPLKI
uniref:Uncharacterized protein n=1 Tax=Anguilla anguilla TaxID=7936 RepID=A0A0E9XIL7_ANGAN